MNQSMLIAFVAMFLYPYAGSAQSAASENRPEAWILSPRIEIVGGVALSHVFRFEDRGFGNRANLGVGMEVPVWRRLRFGAELNHTFGLTPVAHQCGSIAATPGEPLPCVGSAREGVSAATAASFTAAWYFGKGRVQPYVLGGASILWTRSVNAVSIVYPDRVELFEISSSDTGAGLALGVGLRAAIARRLSIRPEFRFYDGSAKSSGNLSQLRLSLGLGYAW